MDSSASPVTHYADLKVWPASVDLTDQEDSTVSAAFHRHEASELASQLRRTSVSTLSNLTEEGDRGKTGESRQFSGYARGSLYEVDPPLCIAVRPSQADGDPVDDPIRQSTEISQMLSGLAKYLRRA